MGLLTLDLGTKTGFTYGPHKLDGGAVISGVWDFKNSRYEGGGMRFLRFRQKLDEIHAAGHVTAVYFEEVRRHLGTDAAHVYGGLLGMLTAWCEEKCLPYAGVPVGTIKKFATGKGNADKAAMIAAVRSWGFEPQDDNEADAIALRRYVIAEESKSDPAAAKVLTLVESKPQPVPKMLSASS